MKGDSYIDRSSRTLTLYAVLFLIVLYLPILFLPLFSFNDSIYIAFPLQGFTTAWYAQMWENPQMWAALGNSVKVGMATAVISTALGVFAAKAITRYRLPGQGPLVGFMMLPLVVPLIILGVAILILMSRLGVPLSLYTVTLGHLLICTPFAIATLIPRFEGLDPSLEEASADLGENIWWTFWRVTFPVVYPGIIASLLLTFTISFDEFIVAFFLAGTEQTLPIYIWNQLRFPRELPKVLALASVILLVSFVVVFLSLWLTNRGNRTLVQPGKDQ
ncbi:ABC transporter permease [Rhodosalinus halophilus]|uniref:ABC transporter permease n=1 Tax=Rhodosalinus halophilus TaxID=2259333 RepID=A0A365U5G7_9RHOB|nr:ABC transporter permease [Rhodosalinus halophilus]RBI83489.1 ABC transporter permease [Rhodosalinus halophilus]